MLGMTIAMFVFAAAVGWVQYLYQNRDAPSLKTFIVDPPTMFVVGALAVVLGMRTRKGRVLALQEFRTRRKWIDRLLLLFFAGFWCMELSSYFDLMAHPYDVTKTGNDFMWNGYVDLFGWIPFHFDQPTYHYWWSLPLLLAMMYVQWMCLRAGRAIGYMQAKLVKFEDAVPTDENASAPQEEK